MDSYTIARALQVLGLVHWIGGVAMVTLVLLPQMLRAVAPAERLALFERIEGSFGAQARISTQVVGASGLWMLWQVDGWALFLDPGHWWLHLMVMVYAVFTIVLFVAEPLILHRWFHDRASRDPDGTFRLVLRLHRVLLALSALAVGAGVLGAHGGL